jgi:hypothetical protein
MKRSKSTLTCSYCSKIFQDPIMLPCKHNLCNENLVEKNFAKQNRIKRIECKHEFDVKDNDFKSNTLVLKLKDELLYLSDEEVSLKKNIKIQFQHSFKYLRSFLRIK